MGGHRRRGRAREGSLAWEGRGGRERGVEKRRKKNVRKNDSRGRGGRQGGGVIEDKKRHIYSTLVSGSDKKYLLLST